MTIFDLTFIIIQIMNEQQQNQAEEAHLKPLAIRLKNFNWQVRKRAYEQILEVVHQVKSVKDEININNQWFTLVKFTAFLNNLVQEKHPNVLLKGLECIESILKFDSKTNKLFNKLVVEGLQKFPLLTQQKKTVLQKFLQILVLCKIEPNTLTNRLNLPQQKSVMFVIQVIGALQMHQLRGKLIQLSKKHPKKEVKQLAAQIAEELDQVQSNGKEQPENKVKINNSKGVTTKKEQTKKPFKMELIQKLAQFQQLNPKQQQKYSEDLLAAINQISCMALSGTLTSFCYYIQVMIQSNNQIISTNGVKMLLALVKNKSQLINTSFPLLFLFRKFKTHKTHATNANLLGLVEALMCSSRSNDLMNAILQGIGCQQNKANLKYGCIVSFIRIFSYYYRQQQLFSIYCIGQYADMYEQIENKKYVQKMLIKSLDIFVKQKQKDKEYAPAIHYMKITLGISINTIISQKSNKQIRNQNKSPLTRNKSNVQNPLKTQPIAKLPAKTTAKPSLIISPEGQLAKISELLQSNKLSESSLKKAISKCLQCTKDNLRQNVFDMFYYCEIADSFIQKYQPNQETDELISHFLIDYLKILSTAQVKASKKTSKITQSGLEYLLKLSTTKLALSKQSVLILNNLLPTFGFQMIVRCLGKIYVMSGISPKKKNKKYMMRWLQENASQEFVNSEYFQVIQAIENNGQKGKFQKKIAQPPSIIHIPSSYKNEPQIKIKQVATKERPKTAIIQPVRNKVDELQILQNADISKIQQIEEQSTDRLDQKWQYFLNKKTVTKETTEEHLYKKKKEEISSQDQQEKYNLTQSQFKENKNTKLQLNYYQNQDQQRKLNNIQYELSSKHQVYQQKSQLQRYYETNKSNQSNQSGNNQQAEENNEDEDEYERGKVQERVQVQQQQKFQYKYLDYQKINYMINGSTNPFSHLRTLILIPFKSQTNKEYFLRELTHLIQSQTLKKPQPFNSILLIVILLFTEIKSDKSIIQPLQFLYEYMAQHCTNNQFLKTIISLYHSVIDQTEEGQRKLLLTILTKSMTRIMPFVQNALELLKDFQQFYQIGQIVYVLALDIQFEMFPDQYNQIKEVIQNSDSLEDVMHKAFEEEGQSLIPIIQGWLETRFKNRIKFTIEKWMQESEEV